MFNDGQEALEPSLTFHAWSLNDSKTQTLFSASQIPNISFHSIRFSDKCVYIWIGDSQSKLENLSCSLKTPYEREPLGIDILLAANEEQNDKNDLSKSLSIRLGQKLNKQVLVSFSVSTSLLDQFSLQLEPVDSLSGSQTSDLNNNNATLLQIIEKRLFTEIKNKPDMF